MTYTIRKNIIKILIKTGIAFFLMSWILSTFSPKLYDCDVTYYGEHDITKYEIAEKILALQMASYGDNYNYQRALEERYTYDNLSFVFECDLVRSINYVGSYVLSGEISQKYAIDLINDQIMDNYRRCETSNYDLQIKWSYPYIVVDNDLGNDVMVSIGATEPVFFLGSYSIRSCFANFSVDNTLNHSVGDTIPCYVNTASSTQTQAQCGDIKLVAHWIESYSNAFFYMAIICFLVVLITTLVYFYNRSKYLRQIEQYAEQYDGELSDTTYKQRDSRSVSPMPHATSNDVECSGVYTHDYGREMVRDYYTHDE